MILKIGSTCQLQQKTFCINWVDRSLVIIFSKVCWNFSPLHYPFSSSVLFWSLSLKLSAGVVWCDQASLLEVFTEVGPVGWSSLAPLHLHRPPTLVMGSPASMGCWGHQQTGVTEPLVPAATLGENAPAALRESVTQTVWGWIIYLNVFIS